MKINATWKKKGLNPFKLYFSPNDYIGKIVEVSDDTDMKELEKDAIEDTQKGYKFIKIEKVLDSYKTSPLKDKSDE